MWVLVLLVVELIAVVFIAVPFPFCLLSLLFGAASTSDLRREGDRSRARTEAARGTKL